MALIGINLNRSNPLFRPSDFVFYMPQFSKFVATLEGMRYYNSLYELSNKKIFKSIYGTDWKLAMSYCIAHYLTLIANQMGAPSGDSLDTIAGGGNFKGVLSDATIGSFSKHYDIDKTMVTSDDAKFWNQTSYGSSLMALYKTKAIPSMMVVTSNPVCGAQNYFSRGCNWINLLNDEILEAINVSSNNCVVNINQGSLSLSNVTDDNDIILSIDDIRLCPKNKIFLVLNGEIEIKYNDDILIKQSKYVNQEMLLTFSSLNMSNTLTITFKAENAANSYIGCFLIKGV